MRKQRNYKIDDELGVEFDGFCVKRDLIRDRTIERAMRLFMDASLKLNTQRFVVELSDDAAADLYAYRRLFFADRSELVEAAVVDFIRRQLDPDKQSDFLRLREEALGRTTN